MEDVLLGSMSNTVSISSSSCSSGRNTEGHRRAYLPFAPSLPRSG